MNKPDSTHFGFREVAQDDKARLVGEVFSSVARNYDAKSAKEIRLEVVFSRLGIIESIDIGINML